MSFKDIDGLTFASAKGMLLERLANLFKVEENLTYDYLHSSEENLWSILYLTGILAGSGCAVESNREHGEGRSSPPTDRKPAVCERI